MDQESRQCQNCKNQFVIEPADFAFYEKIQVPAPTWCPECRFQRRFVFHNLTHLYKRPCALCGKVSLTNFPPEAPHVVYCPQCWWSDAWDAGDYGRNYDFSRSFFEQYNEMLKTVPLIGLSIDPVSAATSPFTNDVGYLKNCYLLFHANENEDCAYGFYLTKNKTVLDSSLMMMSEECYDCMHCFKVNHCVGARSQVTESLDCYFLKDSQNCQNCFASANLRNKKYYIFNKPHTKEEYFAEIKKYNLGSYKTYKEMQKKAEEHWKTQIPKSEFNEFVVNCSGPNIFDSRNVKNSMEVVGAEDCRYVCMMWDPPIKDCYDISSWGNNLSLSYEGCVVGENASNLRFCWESGIGAYHAEYCKLITGGAEHAFGCVSIKKKKYVILNKQYSKAAYDELVPKIRRHMNEMSYVDKRGRIYKYGEFFPPELSPFAYNETLAHNFFPLTKETCEEEGWRWKEFETTVHHVTKRAEELPDDIKDASDELLQEIVGCNRCGKGFKIIPAELQLLRKWNLPLPRECALCRVTEKLNLWVKNMKQYKRTCARCGTQLDSKYTKEEAPAVLCKTCYRESLV